MALSFKQHPLYQEELALILSTKGIEQLRGKTVLITGSTGLLGTQLIDALMKYNAQGAGLKVIAVGRSREKVAERLGEYLDSPLFQFLQHDIVNPFHSSVRADYILPLASSTHPMAYSLHPIETMTANFLGALHALRLAEVSKATVVYPSSVEIYGNATTEKAFTEDMTGALDLSTSRAFYTEAKRACEALCQSFVSEKEVDVKVARLCRVFGPTLLRDDSKASSQFILKALEGEDIVLKSEGRQVFSYIYAADAVRALLHIMLNGERGAAYNVSSEESNILLRDFANICAERAGSRVVFDIPSEQEQRGYSIAARAVIDSTRLYATGWAPAFSLRQAIERTLSILKD